MEKYLPVLQSCTLFQDIAANDIPGLLTCLGANLRSFKKQYGQSPALYRSSLKKEKT